MWKSRTQPTELSNSKIFISFTDAKFCSNLLFLGKPRRWYLQDAYDSAHEIPALNILSYRTQKKYFFDIKLGETQKKIYQTYAYVDQSIICHAHPIQMNSSNRKSGLWIHWDVAHSLDSHIFLLFNVFTKFGIPLLPYATNCLCTFFFLYVVHFWKKIS